MTRPKMGDIIEIPTSKGLFYAQYSQKHPRYGAMLRVFENAYPSRPSNFAEIARSRPAFSCFFPLGAAMSRGIFSAVDNVDIPLDARSFPTFRSGVADPVTGKVAVWWLWDGEKEWSVEHLTEEQRKFSIRGVWNDTYLIERLESGWRPENDPA